MHNRWHACGIRDPGNVVPDRPAKQIRHRTERQHDKRRVATKAHIQNWPQNQEPAANDRGQWRDCRPPHGRIGQTGPDQEPTHHNNDGQNKSAQHRHTFRKNYARPTNRARLVQFRIAGTRASQIADPCAKLVIGAILTRFPNAQARAMQAAWRRARKPPEGFDEAPVPTRRLSERASTHHAKSKCTVN